MSTRRWPRYFILPLGLLVLWQLWGMTLPARSRAPVPLDVLASAVDLIASGRLPMAILQSLGRVGL
ncbi:MAG: hypothetical protein KDG49_12000, partial [Geminicoccaceae bacterium]|nr:hypothetical protein [Geminicoccaceae bacterium]